MTTLRIPPDSVSTRSTERLKQIELDSDNAHLAERISSNLSRRSLWRRRITSWTKKNEPPPSLRIQIPWHIRESRLI